MCDLALLFEGMMVETQTLRDEEETVSLEGLLEFFLDSAVPPMVVIAAEICAKLIMRGRIENKTIMAKVSERSERALMKKRNIYEPLLN